MFPISNEELGAQLAAMGLTDITAATIRQISTLSRKLEAIVGEPFVHLEMGNPGLPASRVGIEAECEALRRGVPGQYPAIGGVPALKDAASRFLKAFLDADIPAETIIPTVGSMQGSFTILTLLKRCNPQKDTILFIDPGFPAQRSQAHIVGLREDSFDIYNYRGAALEAMLESKLASGRVAALIYSCPNNPAWINLTQEELEIIGRMATKHDVIVLEDLAYMGMDFRTDQSHPGEPPYIPTVAKYTDNYVLLASASKIFSYAGQRVALACISSKLYHRTYAGLKDFFGIPAFGPAYIFGVLYAASSGTSHSAQYALAAMLQAAVDGTLDFVDDSREYGRRAAVVKDILLRNGFHIVYAADGTEPIADGFFFTATYGDMPSSELQHDLMRFGVSAISLPTTGSRQHGVRICVSMISDEATMDMLDQRLAAFHRDHPLSK